MFAETIYQTATRHPPNSHQIATRQPKKTTKQPAYRHQTGRRQPPYSHQTFYINPSEKNKRQKLDSHQTASIHQFDLFQTKIRHWNKRLIDRSAVFSRKQNKKIRKNFIGIVASDLFKNELNCPSSNLEKNSL